MPYTPHKHFTSPTDPNVKIWRYLDFTKYVSLLDQRSLFFARADNLGDRFEGSITAGNLAAIKQRLLHLSPDDQIKGLGYYTDLFRRAVTEMAISSWHMNEHESAGMWKLYLLSHEGVAIQSSFSRLVDSVAGSPHEVMIGEITYIDYSRERMPEDNVFWPFLHKRKSFEHERELRALVWKPQEVKVKGGKQEPVIDAGVSVEVDLERLVEHVYVAPTAPGWLRELVKSVSLRYGLHREPVRSDLASDPLF
jgi:hypothetical protein